MKKIKLNQWNFIFGIVEFLFHVHKQELYFGLFKPNDLIPEGEVLSKKYYKGFLFRQEIKIKLPKFMIQL